MATFEDIKPKSLYREADVWDIVEGRKEKMRELKTYVVNATAKIGLYKTVRARSKKEAAELAMKLLGAPTACHGAFSEEKDCWQVDFDAPEPIASSIEVEEHEYFEDENAISVDDIQDNRD